MKKVIKSISDEFIYGGHLLSLGAVGIVWSVIIMTGAIIIPPIFLLAYLTMLIIYQIDHISGLLEDLKSNPERTRFFVRTKTKQYLLLLCYVIAYAITGMFVALPAFLWAVFIVFGGIIYSKKIKQMTIKIAGFKNYYVSLFWSFLVFLVPLYYLQSPLQAKYLLIFSFIFIRGIVNTVFYDIKDIESDRDAKLKTFPVIFGIKKTIFLLHTVNIFSGILLGVFAFTGYFPFYSIIWLVFVYYAYYYLVIGGNSRSRLRKLSYLIVDIESICWPIVLLLGKFIYSLYQ